MKYKFLGSFEPDEVNGVCGDSNEEEAHDIEIKGSPVVFEDHVRVSSEEYDEVQLLSFVRKADHIL